MTGARFPDDNLPVPYRSGQGAVVQGRITLARAGDDGTTVLIVDDHVSFAEALGTAIDLQDDLRCVGFAPNLGRALQLAAAQSPDVVLMDVRLPDGDGIDGTQRLKEKSPSSRVVVLTAHTDLELMARAAARGAAGFLPKESPVAEILRAIRTAGEGGMMIEHSTLSAVLERLEADHGSATAKTAPSLTTREAEVLALMGEGMDPRAISRQLGVSLHTARTHVKNVMSKLGVHSQLEAVVSAVRQGLVAPPAA